MSINKHTIGQNINKLKKTIESSHVNFLFGSGMSNPYLITLGNIEKFITELDKLSMRSDIDKKDSDAIKIVRGSIYNLFFKKIIKKNLDILDIIKFLRYGQDLFSEKEKLQKTLEQYKEFFSLLQKIITKRKSNILNKQINIFTTNIDIFLEIGAEQALVEYSDGFHGKFCPIFSINNFRKSVYRNSFQYDNSCEIPMFNIIKIHGSLTWKPTYKANMPDHNDSIVYNHDLTTIAEINSLSDDQCVQRIIEAIDKSDINQEEIDQVIIQSIEDAKKLLEIDSTILNVHESFIDSYQSKLAIVNPTKAKFNYTVIDQTYYELLRLYTNVLEKENSVLLVMGFSFADEHIRSLTLRAANFNPTLMVYIIAYSEVAAKQIQENLQKEQNACNHNIIILYPDSSNNTKTQQANSNIQDDAVNNDLVAEEQQYNYDFETINRDLFTRLQNDIEHSNNGSDKIKNAE